MGKTMPFILFRIVVYVGIAIAYVLVTGVGAGVGLGVGSFWGADGQAGGRSGAAIFGFGLTAAVLYFLREYILYIVKAGHIAVLVELIDGRTCRTGRPDRATRPTVVKARFAETSVLFAIDQLVKGVLGAIIGLVQGLAALLPIPGLQQIVGLVRAFLQIAVGFVDEVILAYAIRTNSTNPWAVGADGARPLRAELQADAQERGVADGHHLRPRVPRLPRDAGARRRRSSRSSRTGGARRASSSRSSSPGR